MQLQSLKRKFKSFKKEDTKQVVLFSKLFVDEIVKALDKKGLHLKDFYKVVGIAPSTIYRWRHYEDVPNLLTYYKICHMLELDCVALLKKAGL